MRLARILLFLLATLVLGEIADLAPASAQGCGPSNPNCIIPTAPAGTSDNRAASTKFVTSAIGSLGGTCSAHQWVNAIAAGLPTCSQPGIADISGLIGPDFVNNSGTLNLGAFTGDVTKAQGSLATTVTKTNGVSFGTFATQNFATPPAIGGTTPAAGAFTTLSATSNLTTNITGSTQCVQANSSGVLSGAGASCGGGGAPGIVLVQNTGSGWTATAPNGSSISCTSSATNCWQEGINYAQTNNYNIKIVCPQTVIGTVVSMTGGLTVGPADGTLYTIEGCSVNWTSAVSTPGVVFDTLASSVFRWVGGYVTYTGTGTSIFQFNPHTATAAGNKTFQFSEVDLPSMQAQATISTGMVRFTNTTANFQIANWNIFHFIGEDGNSIHFYAASCVYVDTPSNTSNAFGQNFIDWGSCQNPNTAGIYNGQGSPTGVLATNIWRGMVGIGTATTYGIITYGKFDAWIVPSISVNAGSLNTGIYIASGANQNYFNVLQAEGTSSVNNNGTGNCGFINENGTLKTNACGSSGF